MTAPRIELHIEELVLHGFERKDRHSIADAFERELSRLLSEQLAVQGVPPALSHEAERARLDAGAIHVAPDSKPASIGAQLAVAVYGGLTR
jgi:hypothetical protein